MMRRAMSRGLETLRHIDSWMSRRDGRRRLLVDARTPVNFRIFAPVYRAPADATLVSRSSSRPATNHTGWPRSTVRRGDVPLITPARAALMKFDAYVASDFMWTRAPARHLPDSDIPRRRREIRLRRAGQIDARMASPVLHQLAPVAQLHRGGRDRCRTAPRSGSSACRRSTAS